jgi:hypothetical protein
MAITRSIEAVGVEAGKLLGAINPDYLPEPVLRDVEAKTRPLAAAIRAMTAECVGFHEDLSELVRSEQQKLWDQQLLAKPDVGEAIN